MTDSNASQEPNPATPASPPRRPRRRSWWRWLLAAVALTAIAVASIPLWAHLIAPSLLARYGNIDVQSLETDGFGRWVARDVTVNRPGFELTVTKAELPSPLGWLGAKLQGGFASQPILVDTWELRLKPVSGNDATGANPVSPRQLFDQINDALATADRAIGTVEIESGRIVGPRGAELARFEAVALRDRTVTGQVTTRYGAASLQLDASDPEHWRASAREDARGIELAAELLSHSDQLKATATVSDGKNEAELAAAWPADAAGFVPPTATLTAPGIRLDQDYAFWRSAPPIQVDANAAWQDGAYQFSIVDSDEPPPAEGVTKAVSAIQVSGNGTLEELTIDRAHVELPWVVVTTDAPVALDFALRNPLENAELALTVDLARLPWVAASGQIQAKLTTTATADNEPVITAQLSGEGLSLADTAIQSVTADIVARGRRIEINTLRLVESEASFIEAEGSIDLDSQSLDTITATVSLPQGSPLARRALSFASWSALDATFEANGPWTNPNLDAQVSATRFETAATRPASIQFSLQGALSSADGEIETTTETSRLWARFELARTNAQIAATFTQIELFANGAKALELQTPARITFDSAAALVGAEGFILRGPGGARLGLPLLAIDRERLKADVYATSVAPSVVQPWLKATIPPLRILELDAQFDFGEGQAALQTSGEALWSISESNTVEASWRASQSANGNPNISIDHIELGSAGNSFLRAKGSAPLSLGWSEGKLIADLNEREDFSIAMTSSPNSEFWKSVAAFLPFALSHPTVEIELSGTLAEPNGKAEVRFDSIAWNPPNGVGKSIDLTEIQLSLLATPSSVEASSVSAKLGRNSITASGKLPLDPATIVDLVQRKRLPSLAELTGDAQIRLVDLPALGDWLPEILREQGEAVLELTFADDAVSGVVRVDQLSTRPLPPLGAISQVKGEIILEDGLLRTEKLTGLAEQSPFTLQGSVDLRELSEPRFDLAFNSKSFPLARGSGVMLTGDIDLQLVSGDAPQPTLTGDVLLTKGLVLVEPNLLASPTKTNKQRPPYFAVEVEPFNDWGLNISIIGDRFLRVSNSYFQGTLSADFMLDGTLGSPLLIGKARADSGRINFPAASLALNAGEATITRDRPTDIQIEAQAHGRLYAHDINLEVSGPLEDPEVAITTNPALTQVEAFLLVTTGTLPSNQTNLAQQSATSLGLFLGKGLFRKLMPQGADDSASRFSLEVGNDITLQGKRTVEAAYELTESLEVEGEYDRRDEYNANLKWTFYEK